MNDDRFKIAVGIRNDLCKLQRIAVVCAHDFAGLETHPNQEEPDSLEVNEAGSV